MSYINTAKGFLEQLVYDLRYEYTGYINMTNLAQFANDQMLGYFYGIVSQLPDEAASMMFSKLKVVTNDIDTFKSTQYKPIQATNEYHNSSRLFPIPKMVFDATDAKPGETAIDGVDYPNIVRLLAIHVLDATIDNSGDIEPTELDTPFDLGFSSEKVKIVNSQALDTLKRNYYRKPSTERVYGVLTGETDSYGIVEITTQKEFILLEYITYPTPLTVSGETALELSEMQLTALKQSVMVKFLERINDNRFKNFIQQKGK